MKAPISIRPPSSDERRQIKAGLHSSDAFVLRRCQIVLASERGERAPAIARQLGMQRPDGAQRDQRFQCPGTGGPDRGVLASASAAHRLLGRGCPAPGRSCCIVRHDVGREQSFWTLQAAAQVSFEQGLIAAPTSVESVRRALQRLGTNWKRAKHGISSPDPQYQLKKIARDRLIAWASQQPGWAIGFADEVWWSRFALPEASAGRAPSSRCAWWSNPGAVPIGSKALACYGVLWKTGRPEQPDRSQLWLRFVTGRPVSAITTQFLDWCTQRLAEQGITSWLLIWDNASWHKSQAVRTWIRAHNAR